MAALRTITATLSGTNGLYTIALNDTVLGREGEHKNAKIVLTPPAEWSAFLGTGTTTSLYMEYINAKGLIGKTEDQHFPAAAPIGTFTFNIPREVMVAPESQIAFVIRSPIAGVTPTEYSIHKTEQETVYIQPGFDATV